MPASDLPCPLCHEPLELQPNWNRLRHYRCPRDGTFVSVTADALARQEAAPPALTCARCAGAREPRERLTLSFRSRSAPERAARASAAMAILSDNRATELCQDCLEEMLNQFIAGSRLAADQGASAGDSHGR